jgi:multiple sugar transport system permease protein
MTRLRDPLLALRYLFLAAAAAFTLLPFVWMVSQSLKDLAGFYGYPPRIIPDRIAWENYPEMWRLIPISSSIFNSFVVATLTTLAQVLTSAFAGFAFAVLRFRGSQLAFSILLTQLMFPLGVIVIPLYIIVDFLDWQNTYWGLVVPFTFTAFGMFLMTQYFRGVPRELFEAARIDGASLFTIWRAIYLPLSVPGLAALGALAFVFYWNSLLWPLLITTESSMKVLAVFLSSFVGMSDAAPQLAMAACTAAVVLPLVVFLTLQRYFISGLVAGALK